MFKVNRWWFREPDQCIVRSGQQSTNKKSYKRKHGLIQPQLSCEGKQKGFGLRGIVMWPERSSWKEVGRKRGYSILAGRISVNVKLARWRKAQRSTGFTTVQNGTSKAGYSGNLQKVGAKGENSRRKNGSGQEA